MAARPGTAAGFLLVCLFIGLSQPSSSAAAVVVADQVTSVGKPVFVKAVTRGLFFIKGGRRVSIRIDNDPAYETLSGADGAAYFKYHPDKPGFHPVRAVSENEEGTGAVLVLAPGESVVVIGVEGGLQQSFFSEEKRQSAREVVGWLNRSYRVVYLTRWFGPDLVKNWLQKEQFPPSVVLRWQGETVFKQMENNGVRVAAVIGSAALLRSAPESVLMRFTFDEDDDAAVSGWEKIREKLEGRSGGPKPASSKAAEKPSKPP